MNSTLYGYNDIEVHEKEEYVEEAKKENSEYMPLLSIRPKIRTGDVISTNRAMLILAKSMFNAGCFSLPNAWKLGGLWVSFGFTFIIAGFNCTHRHALNYGHFTKKVFDNSESHSLRRNSKLAMYVVNVTILFYQLGMCSVAVLFVADNLRKIFDDWFHFDTAMLFCTSVAIVVILVTNMFTELKVISIFAMISTLFFLLGAVLIVHFSIQQPTKIDTLPAYTDFKSTIMFIGMVMYSFEGQTMILPIENKMRSPDDFLNNCGVLPTTMMSCTLFMIALGFYGYTAFGDDVQQTITLNMPNNSFYTMVNAFLMIQSVLGYSISMYVIFDMFFAGFLRKSRILYPELSRFWMDKGFRAFWVFVTYLMAMLIPKLDILIPLIGVTSGTLCALVYPPLLEMAIFWPRRKTDEYRIKIVINCLIVSIGLLAVIMGLYANIDAISVQFYSSESYFDSVS